MNKVEALNQFFTKLTDVTCDNLIDIITLKKDVQTTLQIKLSQDQLSEIRNISVSKFGELINSQSEELLTNIKMDDKVNELKLLQSKNKNNISGWRPSGDPLRDSYGDRRFLLEEYVEKLEALKKHWMNKIKEIENAC